MFVKLLMIMFLRKIDPILNDIISVLGFIKIINKIILEPIDGFLSTLVFALNKAIDLVNVFITFKLFVWNSIYKMWRLVLDMNIKLLSGDIL